MDGRPSPAALEWMMALPDGWTDLPGIGPKARRRLLGNAVCPAQAYAALAVLVPRLHEGAPGAAPTLDTSGPYG
ncbi:hypothetical protein [Streptomyces sp. NBC_00207]|uniref:hypothetical protein n=1 Tax=Streptomyces sp. NBC_00207 TaxID=2903635 RepID=UPI0032490B5E